MSAGQLEVPTHSWNLEDHINVYDLAHAQNCMHAQERPEKSINSILVDFEALYEQEIKVNSLQLLIECFWMHSQVNTESLQRLGNFLVPVV